MARVHGSQFIGTCKFWNAVKGYGFLTDSNGGSDLFVGQADLVTGDTRFRALKPGQQIQCEVGVEANGKISAKVVKALGGANLPSFKDKFTAKRAIEASKPMDPNKSAGTIKWFNEGKNFGFIVPDNGGADVFFHLSECIRGIIPQKEDNVLFQMGVDKKGEAVAVKVQNKSRHANVGGMMPQMMPQAMVAAGPGTKRKIMQMPQEAAVYAVKQARVNYVPVQPVASQPQYAPPQQQYQPVAAQPQYAQPPAQQYQPAQEGYGYGYVLE